MTKLDTVKTKIVVLDNTLSKILVLQFGPEFYSQRMSLVSNMWICTDNEISQEGI